MKYLIILLLLTGNAYAKEKKSSFWKKFLRRSISGSIGHASIIGADYRGYSHLRGRFDHSFFDSNKIVAEGLFEYTDIHFAQKLNDWIQEDGNPNNLAEKRTFKYQKSNFRAEELYISQEIGDLLTLSYGVQKIVWGQFEPYSPTNLVFPFNLSTTDVEFNKVKGTLPQLAGVATIYPTDNITLSLYAFPELTYDNVIKNRFDNPGTYRVPGREEITRDVRLPDGSDELQTGIRLMFYPSWGTFGLSYHKGYNTTQPFSNDIIAPVPAPEGDGDDFYTREQIGLAKREMFGVELAIPSGSFVYKLELSSSKTNENIRYDYELIDLDTAGDFRGSLQEQYFNAIRDDNNFKLTIPARQNIMAAGVTGNLSRWYLNLVIFFIKTQYKDKYQNLVDLNKQLDEANEQDDEDSERSWFPGGVISYYLNRDKSSELGLAAGIISNGSGGALFYKKTTDKFVYGAALQAIEYFSNDNITESSSDDYERENDISAGALLSLTYKF